MLSTSVSSFFTFLPSLVPKNDNTCKRLKTSHCQQCGLHLSQRRMWYSISCSQLQSLHRPDACRQYRHNSSATTPELFVGEQEFRGLSPEELKACEEACKPGGCHVADLDRSLLQSLHRKGLVHLDVPIRSDDHVSIPPLEASSCCFSLQYFCNCIL